MEHTWKAVRGYEGCYEVSDQGAVRSLPRATRGRGGKPRVSRGTVLKAYALNGYLLVSLHKFGEGETRYVHSLVAEAFIGPRPQGQDVHHADGDKGNNSASNLRYVSRSENVRHAFESGLSKRGSAHYAATIDEATAAAIWQARGTGSRRRVAERFGVGDGCVLGIWFGRTWKHVTREA
jgi:hypothetical protein